jgi:hypothetical protein
VVFSPVSITAPSGPLGSPDEDAAEEETAGEGAVEEDKAGEEAAGAAAGGVGVCRPGTS